MPSIAVKLIKTGIVWRLMGDREAASSESIARCSSWHSKELPRYAKPIAQVRLDDINVVRDAKEGTPARY